ncbi:MAG: diguanylate cyclase [Actinobacteria bacterium]|nr:diguanylate cyclase [Actinomycetota bacterium]
MAAIDAAVASLHEAIDDLHTAVFALEHGHLWLVAQRGYAVVPDGIGIEQGIVGRAVRQGRAQLVIDVHSDPDYLEVLPAVVSEATVPLCSDRATVGVLNLESERPLPEEALKLLRPLSAALASKTEGLRASGKVDLPALVRLFVSLGSLRDPNEIAALAAASFARVLRLEMSQVWIWDEAGRPLELAAWSPSSQLRGLTVAALEAARGLVDPRLVLQQVDAGAGSGTKVKPGVVIWLPLRAHGKDIGALVGAGGGAVSPEDLDTAAVLAAHTAASLDAALALRRERQSAVTDALTGILNRRGLEERLEREVAIAQERRLPLSVLVLDCDDFKDVNDRAGHEFGDSLLKEVADALTGSLPESAEVARLGGDEFVVMLVGADAEAAEEHGTRIRSVLAEGLTDAGFPIRLSGGVATYPFDGATPTEIVRAADQALYFAKHAGKDRIASFRDIVTREEQPEPKTVAMVVADEKRSGSRRNSSVLSEALAAVRAIEAEENVDGVLGRLCKAVVFSVGATACQASRVEGGYLVDGVGHALREVSLGHDVAYRISDFPLTAETLRLGEPFSVSFLDKEVDPAEAFILRELGMNAMLMLPLRVKGRSWGLLEIYDMRLRRFNEDDVSLARFLVSQAERQLEQIAPATGKRDRPPVYELPPESDEPPGTRSR